MVSMPSSAGPHDAVEDPDLDLMQRAGWSLPSSLLPVLSDDDRRFIRAELSGRRTRAYYRRRLEWLGMAGMDRVLDAGCGMGQWSVALAEGNGHVDAVDINSGRLMIAAQLIDELGVRNCAIRNAPLERLPFEDGRFDGVFCYGVFMFTDMPRSLAEFRRVLRPQGRLYLNANAAGWYAHLLLQRPAARLSAARMLVRSALGRSSRIVVRRRWLEALLHAAGFRVVMMGAEGQTSFHAPPPGERPAPAYEPRFLGARTILEVAAVRP